MGMEMGCWWGGDADDDRGGCESCACSQPSRMNHKPCCLSKATSPWMCTLHDWDPIDGWRGLSTERHHHVCWQTDCSDVIWIPEPTLDPMMTDLSHPFSPCLSPGHGIECGGKQCSAYLWAAIRDATSECPWPLDKFAHGLFLEFRSRPAYALRKRCCQMDHFLRSPRSLAGGCMEPYLRIGQLWWR